MKLAYVCYWDAFADDGVSAKIASQVAAWRSSGHQVELFCLSPRSRRREPVLDGTLFLFDRPHERLAATSALRRAVHRYSPDLVYLRYDIFVPSLGPLLRRFVSVVEVNTDDRREVRLRRWRAQLVNGRNRRVLLGAASGLVCVTRELARANADFGKPTVVITNGTALRKVGGAAPRRTASRRAVFLAGSQDPWQGAEKLVPLARSLPEWEFVLVGVAGVALPSDTPANVRLQEPVPWSDYAELLADADVGFGTLALHRKGMDEAAPLKVREYLAYGLPVVIAYEDTDFADEQPWFLLRLPNIESNVRDNISEIASFLERVRGRRVPLEQVAPIIGADAKEAARLEFFSELLAGAGQPPERMRS